MADSDALTAYINSLDQELRQYLVSEKLPKAIEAIGQEHALEEEQIVHIKDIVYEVLLGFRELRPLPNELGETLDVSDDELAELMNKLGERVIKPVEDVVPFADHVEKETNDDAKTETEQSSGTNGSDTVARTKPPAPPKKKKEENKQNDHQSEPMTQTDTTHTDRDAARKALSADEGPKQEPAKKTDQTDKGDNTSAGDTQGHDQQQQTQTSEPKATESGTETGKDTAQPTPSAPPQQSETSVDTEQEGQQTESADDKATAQQIDEKELPGEQPAETKQAAHDKQETETGGSRTEPGKPESESSSSVQQSEDTPDQTHNKKDSKNAQTEPGTAAQVAGADQHPNDTPAEPPTSQPPQSADANDNENDINTPATDSDTAERKEQTNEATAPQNEKGGAVNAGQQGEAAVDTDTTADEQSPQSSQGTENKGGKQESADTTVADAEQEDETQLKREQLLKEIQGEESGADTKSPKNQAPSQAPKTTPDIPGDEKPQGEDKDGEQTNDPNKKYGGKDPYREPIE